LQEGLKKLKLPKHLNRNEAKESLISKPKRCYNMNKKAQGLSINVIIVAAIALVILVVLIAIFSGRIGLFGKGVEKTTTGNMCVESCFATDQTEAPGVKVSVVGNIQAGGCQPNYHQVYGLFQDLKEGEVCCVLDSAPQSDGKCAAR
jgi:hypothetical protein